MSKTQSTDKKDQRLPIFFGLALLIIVITFLLFTPKVSSLLFPFKRQMVYNNFIDTVKKNNGINAQAYWEFREFYSPGSFVVSKSGLSSSEVQKAEDSLGVNIKPDSLTLPFAAFSSPKLQSIDSLTTKKDLKEAVSIVSPANIIFRNNNAIIYKDGEKSVKIIFLKPEKDMKKAVGFFEYNDQDNKIVQGKNWLNITTLSLD